MSAAEAFYVLEGLPALRGVDEGPTDFLEAYIPGTTTLRTGAAPRCPRCGIAIGSLEWLPPFEGELECWGRDYADIIPKVNGQDMLVSGRLKALYEEFGLTGLSGFEPVRITRVKRRFRRMRGEQPEYYRVDAARSRTAVDQVLSGYVWKTPPTCDECRIGLDGRRSEGIFLEPGTWSGEDIFRPRGGDLLVSARFQSFCEEHGIRNTVFIPAEQFWQDSYAHVDDAEAAHEVLRQPVGGPIWEKTIRDGKVMRFDTRSNRVVIYEYVESATTKKKDLLVIRGNFKPRDAHAFWNRHPQMD